MQNTLDAAFAMASKLEWTKSGLEDKIMAFVLETDQVESIGLILLTFDLLCYT
jgi:hypothetical protein